MTTIVVVAEADEQLRTIIDWWRNHRPKAPGLVLEEFTRCVRLLEAAPDVGAPFHRSAIPGVRRLVMRKTRHLIYYLHDSERSMVYVLAVWGAPKQRHPRLRGI
jgi:plasmid stabilization system protein ParE